MTPRCKCCSWLLRINARPLGLRVWNAAGIFSLAVQRIVIPHSLRERVTVLGIAFSDGQSD
jgi:hypothetical protein